MCAYCLEAALHGASGGNDNVDVSAGSKRLLSPDRGRHETRDGRGTEQLPSLWQGQTSDVRLGRTSRTEPGPRQTHQDRRTGVFKHPMLGPAQGWGGPRIPLA